MPMHRKQVAAALQYLGDKADLKRRYERMVSLDQPQDTDAVDMALEMGGSLMPGVGQALAARDFERARRAGDETGMAMAGAAIAPGARIAKMLGKVPKSIRVSKSSDELHQAAVESGKMSPSTAAELAEAERLQDAGLISKEVGKNARRAEGASKILLTTLESDIPDFRHTDAREVIKRAQGLLQSRSQQNNPLQSRLKAAYQYSNSIGGLTNPNAPMSRKQRTVLSDIVRGDLTYNELGELQRVK
jgi:hypothetical protein